MNSHLNIYPFFISAESQEATLVRFHTTFHYNDGFKHNTHGVAEDQLKLLRQELEYAKETLKNVQQNKQTNGHANRPPCEHHGVPKCQVSSTMFKNFILPLVCVKFAFRTHFRER